MVPYFFPILKVLVPVPEGRLGFASAEMQVWIKVLLETVVVLQ